MFHPSSVELIYDPNSFIVVSIAQVMLVRDVGIRLERIASLLHSESHVMEVSIQRKVAEKARANTQYMI